MAKTFYGDTSVWRDYLEDRRDGLRPLGEFAFQFLQDCLAHGCRVLYAEPVLFELQAVSAHWVQHLLTTFKGCLVQVHATRAQAAEAREIAKHRGMAFNDVFHAVIARDHKAVLVTRDRHFEELLDIVESKTPEDVTFG